MSDNDSREYFILKLKSSEQRKDFSHDSTNEKYSDGIFAIFAARNLSPA